ncbi:hypothetical protein TNCV_5019901 [Trichonephila clavipes]|nr:hypothetical protein TNCV_5019901 [Trichonephila clavipes]
MLMCVGSNVDDSLLSPYILSLRLDSDKYLVFVQEVLPELLTDVPAPVRHCSTGWKTPNMHFGDGRCVFEYLEKTFPNRRIEHRGPIAWPFRSPDLSSLDFFLGCHEEPCVLHARLF